MRTSYIRSLPIGFLFLWTNAAWGRCVLGEDEGIADLKGAFCSVNNLHLFGFGAETADLRSELAAAIDTDTSYYIYPKISLHWKGYAKAYTQSFKTEENNHEIVRVTDQGFIHFGHHQIDPVQLSVGRLPLPFGLHHEILRYQLPHRNEMFWDRSVNGAVLTWRFRNDLAIDVGGTNKNPDELADKEFSAFTIRATQHLDLLSGTKLIGSYQNTGGKTVGKMGFATLVFNNEDVSSLEWIRIAENFKTQTYAQLFRFVYQVRDRDWQWTFEYEDLRRDSYRTGLSHGRDIREDLNISGTLQYERLRFTKQSNWVGLLNLTYNITAQTNILKWGGS